MAFKVMHLVEYLYQGGIERFLGEFARLVPDEEVGQVYFAYEMESFNGVSEEIRNLKKDISIYKKNKSFDYQLVSLLSRLVKEKKSRYCTHSRFWTYGICCFAESLESEIKIDPHSTYVTSLHK